MLFQDSHSETHKGLSQLSHCWAAHQCKSRVSVWSPFLRWHVEDLTDVSIPPTSSHARTHCQQHPNQINLRDMAYTSRSWEMKSLLASSPQTKSKEKLPFDIVQACVKGAHWSLLHINTAPVKSDRKIWHFAYHKVFKDEDELIQITLWEPLNIFSISCRMESG